MNKKLVCAHDELMRYGIREVVEVVQQLQALDPHFQVLGENIGDPVAKGWEVPAFIKDILVDLIRAADQQVLAYTHSHGNIATRQWIAAHARRCVPTARLDSEEVLFVNGLGAGISMLYRLLAPTARILQPLPAYPTHISAERFHAGAEAIGYRLDPARQWQPDLEHLADQLQRHPEVAGLLLINPNNPTGAVYPAAILEEIVRLAERHGLFLISDEVYFRLVYNQAAYTHITALAQDRVPLLVMRGVSKDMPWPGARCGWLEFHNLKGNPAFQSYFQAMRKAIMLEVCATSLPQAALPLIYDHPQYAIWLKRYRAELAANAQAIYAILSRAPGISVNPIQGAFYMTILFEEGRLNERQSLPIANARAADLVRRLVAPPTLPLDKRFAYYLLAATGICVVPATDFESPWPGFRITTLERDAHRRDHTDQPLTEVISAYLASA